MTTLVSPDDDDAVVGPSDRSFGLTFGAIFLIVSLLPLWRGGAPRVWALATSATLCGIALVRPAVLAPANRIWLRIGIVLHRVVNPVVMAVIYYAVITPVGLVTRLFRTGLTRRLRIDAKASTYWIARKEGTSRMDQQF